MRFFAVLALTAVASAASTSLTRRQDQFPACSTDCLTNADFGSCDPLDDGCLCNDPGFVNSVTSCIQTACQGSDLTNAEGAAQALCAAVGVTLTSASTSTATTPATASTSGSTPTQSSASAGTDSTSAPAASQTAAGNNGAASHGASALVALVAVGAAALVL
ncbi:hypothetical protein C8Q80DRAFT_481356 [Daedaleopsis nitida]|nr:hypothetical protein C8Q80DRAFT_481356 [Daedaleopsis nitida]